MIRRWHIDQAIREDSTEALVHLSITSSNEVQACSIGVEPEHALILLPSLEEVLRVIRTHASHQRMDRTAQIYTLPRRA